MKLSNNSNSLKILETLVAVQSDTGTISEKALGEKILTLIQADSYFKKHPELCGSYVNQDFLKRPVIWALKKGQSNQTVILSGHYDAVEIRPYGRFEKQALQPSELKKALKKESFDDKDFEHDVHDPKWMFGRGVGDMKGGLACAMDVLFRTENPKNSILFVAVYDEENLSAGMRNALPLIAELKEKHNLQLEICIIGEPQLQPPESQSLAMYAGGAGKIMPIIVAKGKLSHSAFSLQGLSANLIIAEIAKNLELNCELLTSDLGFTPQPPAGLIMRDLKETYDVSLPEFAYTCLSVLFYGTSPLPIIEKTRKICEESVQNVITHYDNAFKKALTMKAISRELYQEFNYKIIDLKTLLEMVKQVLQLEFDNFISKQQTTLAKKINHGEMTLQTASSIFIMNLLKQLKTDDLIVVVGICPPYYPAVSSFHLNVSNKLEKHETLFKQVTNELNINPLFEAYFNGMGDISYTICYDVKDAETVMSKMALPPPIYDILFNIMSKISVPTYWLGPRSKGMHEWTERVWLEDITKNIPFIYSYFVENL